MWFFDLNLVASVHTFLWLFLSLLFDCFYYFLLWCRRHCNISDFLFFIITSHKHQRTHSQYTTNGDAKDSALCSEKSWNGFLTDRRQNLQCSMLFCTLPSPIGVGWAPVDECPLFLPSFQRNTQNLFLTHHLLYYLKRQRPICLGEKWMTSHFFG